ncbi:MAG: GGDEF domain-containing protein [Lachnospiraceae bacterium]|nr:GGDEF domain-containing protein [Lachnospiraceae bacterium]
MNDERKETYGKKKVFETALILTLIILIVFMMANVSRIQGTARVVNYAGIVRGATQRLVKLEISNMENPELEQYLDEILAGLKDGSSNLNLVRLDDKDYQEKLTTLSNYWKELKDEIEDVREYGAERTDIIAMSEEYFRLADDTVSAAEMYSQKNASKVRIIEIFLVIVILALIIFMLKEVSEAIYLARVNSSLNQKAFIDLHTGLPNKSRCEEILTKKTFLTVPTACIMYDMNGLKKINDTFGHVAGDAVIKNFANIIRKNIPEQQFVGRYGGDEFVAVITDTTDQDVLQIIAKIKLAVEEFNSYGGKISGTGIALCFACGYAISTDYSECTMQTILDKADHNMYLNKKEMLQER